MKNFFYIAVLAILFNNVINAETTICYQVVEGWNLIGSPCDGDISSIVTTTPTGIITGPWYKYAGGYQATTTLTAAEGYWVKVTQAGQICFTCDCPTCANCGTVEYGGKTYNTVYIGTQCWLRENLDIGDRIDIINPQTNNGTIEKYCYDDNFLYCHLVGGLYQWDEAMQYSTTPGAQGICPPGWHIPTDAQFATLSSNVLGDGNALTAIGWGAGAGTGTNESCFTALLGGYSEPGSSTGFGSHAIFWSSQDLNPNAGYLSLFFNNNTIFLSSPPFNQENGASVRCLKD